MRVSTAQFYLQSSQQMSQKSSDVNDQMAYLSSGKRVLTAKDDAISYSTLAGYNNDLASIEKYKRNITMAESHNNMQEIVFADADLILDKIKSDMLLANNGRMSSEDIQSLAEQVKSNFSQLLDLANSQNENGDYIFSGYQTQQKPFSQNVDGSVTYNGDSGVRELQVAKNINIATNQAGDAAFLKVENAIGDFTANYTANTSGVAVESAKITNRDNYNSSALPHDYTFTFDAITNDLTVTGSAGVVFPAAPYTAGQTISFDGIDVTLNGNPLPGDSFTISEQEEMSVFDTINNAIAWMEKGSVSVNQEQHQVDYNALLNQLSSAMNHITSRRVDSGIRLQTLESQENRHLDSALNLAKGKSNIEDLDFAKAISEFEQSKLALQASQQAFSKVQGLSLFNYI
ncbi:flagellar hook-associated protein FlgL [Colwellia hornerae]|uniref:Flagellar hook-associated protein 3 n=1 Tax=Colwellia hornerae TaxID=89402 RepID=A0A5C6Q4D4_9GAMM|nr:flagellar hook-associated protein FlgL [Colwellia hornerae]TWX54137.1 flagellar hook-associated protein 3 [Colwellia hornerae]TWX60912.1 flagellar hook-associated protein 3 [Colwellia hornerae]TWX63649.1 flagellar hook-associated protein 3 [Colwellia hornerae]